MSRWITGLVALTLVANGCGDDATSATSSTLSPGSSVPTASSSTSTSSTLVDPTVPLGPPLVAGSGVLDPSYGMALVVVDGERTQAVDLATGAQAAVPAPPGMVRQLAWTGEVLISLGDRSLSVLDDQGAWHPVESGDLEVHEILFGGLVSLRDADGDVVTGAVAQAGTLRTWRIPDDAVLTDAVGVWDEQLIVGTVDGAGAVSADGEVRDIADGAPLALAGPLLLHQTCRAGAQCSLALVDLNGASAPAVPPLPGAFTVQAAALAPGGSAAIVMAAEGRSPARTFVLAGGGWLELDRAPVGVLPASAWSSDGEGLVWVEVGPWPELVAGSVTLGGRAVGLQRTVPLDPGAVGARPDESNGRVAIVPLSALPSVLQPS